jgi:hypothetical protein
MQTRTRDTSGDAINAIGHSHHNEEFVLLIVVVLVVIIIIIIIIIIIHSNQQGGQHGLDRIDNVQGIIAFVQE